MGNLNPHLKHGSLGPPESSTQTASQLIQPFTKSTGPRPTSIPSGILIHPAILPQQTWTKNWWLCPFLGGRAGSPSSTMSLGTRATCIPSVVLIHPAVWPYRTWAKNWEGLCPFGGGGAGSPSNTMWPGPRPTYVPSFLLIHPTVWTQCTNVTDRQDRQTGQWSDSIGRTVLETVAQELFVLI